MRQHKLFYGSSPDRGLDVLLFMWPDIRLKYPDAELHVCYGWAVFDMVAHNNPERMRWKETVIEMMKQPGIIDHGRVGKDELKKIRQTCGIWAYPTYFTEINCITALECQADGCVPATMAYAALKYTVGTGVIVQGDIYEPEVKDRYLKELLDLMGDAKRWKKEQKKGIKFAQGFEWGKIAYKWHREFVEDDQSVKLTVYTPTVRRGFWNIMAENLSKQTYKNFEWLIVDDYPTDRSKLAQEYAKRYGLDVRYVRGKERAKKRTYALVNANNTALNEARGEVLVFLQDFILIPQDGLEQIATLYRKNPDSLLALPDIYVASKVKPDIDSEDWFNGQTDVVGEFIRQNLRIQNKGLRFTTRPFDFEQNWGAIPVKIARELGGWYEFMDEGLGYDNTDIALRALKSGYKILLDETNIAICIDHWEALKGNRENVLGRARRLNDPRYSWELQMIEKGKLPLIRTQAIDDRIELLYDIPESVGDEAVVDWLKENGPQVVYDWLKKEII